jgi:hypothetical protein
MKQGSADDPFAEEPTVESGEADESADSAPTGEQPSDGGVTDAPTESTTTEQTDRSLPYIHARDGVKDGRTQRPVFLRDHIETGIDDLVAQMEAELGADVYKTDVTEAAMAVAQEHPELVREKLDEWGYGWA